MISLYLAIIDTYMKIYQAYLNKINFKLLLEWNHCTAHCSQKKKEISFYYLTCICICEAVHHLKTKGYFRYICSQYVSVAVLITHIKKNIHLGGYPLPLLMQREKRVSPVQPDYGRY